jgi:hypothetical protein
VRKKDGKQTTLGYFVGEEEAARAYDAAAAPLGRPVNFPPAAADTSAPAAAKGTKGGSPRVKPKHVYWGNEVRQWEAKIKKGGQMVSLGYFNDVQDAERAYDVALAARPLEEAALNVSESFNFPAVEAVVVDARAVKGSHGGGSRFKGVSWDKGKSMWEAQICNDNKRTRLGRFKDEEEAARTYDVAAAKF